MKKEDKKTALSVVFLLVQMETIKQFPIAQNTLQKCL